MTTAQMDISLVTFKAIANFCTSLEEIFGKTQRSLKLYAHLIGKTTLSHEKAISKHVSAFTLFCTSNRDALETKDYTKLVENKISYSDRVFIDMSQIFPGSDKGTSDVIWTHLLTIAALVDPTGKARQILKATAKKEGAPTEANFLNDIIGKVEEHVDPNANPMEAVSSIMKSGVFTDLVSGMGNGLQDGSLDLGKLMGTVQTMVTTLSGETGEEGQNSENPMEMINTLLGSISAGAQDTSTGEGTPEGAPEGAPDLGGLMNMVGPMLGALSQAEGPPTIESIENQIETQTAKAREDGAFSELKSSEE